MGVRGSFAAASLIVAAMGGCAGEAGETGEEGASEETLAPDGPLDITVDSLDIVHGALRISATMVDGSADVSVQLGGDCEHREVGGGFSTPSTLVWALGGKDVAGAIACGLTVRARVRDGERRVNKVGDLVVSVDIAAQGSEDDEAGPHLQSVTISDVGVSAVFAPVSRSARLTAGDSIVEAEPPESREDPAPDDDTGRFTVLPIDLARSVLRGRPLVLDGSSFAISLSVGGTSLEGEAQGPDEAQEGPEEAPQPTRHPQ
jgi:hypothetical protein